jgi:hypothetical protein
MLDKSLRDKLRASVINYFGTNEIFIPDIENPIYLVSNYGNIISTYTNKKLRPTKNNRGYYYVKLYCGSKKSSTVLVHRLVARNFLNIGNYEVNHINADKSDNTIFNLELTSRQENLEHARQNNLFKSLKLELSPSFKFTKDIVDDMIYMKNCGFKLKQIADKYKTSVSYTSTLIKNRLGGLR